MKKQPFLKTFSFVVIAALLALSLTSFSVQPAQAATGAPACTAGGLAAAINAAPAGGAITYAADCAITLSGEITFPAATTVINGNGHRVTLTAASGTRLFTVPAGATVTLRGLVLTGGNLANGNGGAIYIDSGALTVENSTFRNNQAADTSGYNGRGGAIYNSAGSLSVLNSTFVSNTAEVYGAAIQLQNSSASLTHVTIANNTAGSGGGAVHVRSSTAGDKILSLYNTVLASNTGNNCATSVQGGSGAPSITNGLGNVSYPASDASCGASGYQTATPNLSASLAYGGGSTQTLAILGTPSSAVNNGVEANCISTDQRGASRDGVCDSGAYEYEGTAIVTTTLLTSTTTNPAVYGTAVALRASVFPAPSAGTVTFSEGVTTFGSATLDAAGIANFSMAQGDLDVGAHTIKATFIPTPDDAVSAGSSGTLVRDVTARPVAVTPDSGQSKQFGDSDPVLTYKVTTGSLVTGDSFTGALTRVSGEVLGPYAILPGSLSLGDNYNLNVASGVTFQVAPRAVEVTADAKTRDYGNADPALTYQVTKGTVLTGDSFTGELTRAVGENVGAYAITQGSLSLGANYAITYVGANLTITARAVTVTANPQTKIYGRDDPVFTYQVTQGTVREGDLFTGALARAAGKIVGTYAINQGTLSLGANYTITFVGADLIITPRPVDVTADAKTLQYGDAEQALTYTMTFGVLIPGDNFTGAIVREPGTDAGTYHITQGTLSLGSNYNMTFIGANYTINRRLVTVTVDAKTKVYGDVDPALTYKITSGSLAPGESFTGMIARDPGEDVGEYAITQFSLALTGNYNLTFSGANLTITPAQLTFTADSMMKHYLEDNPPLTYKVTGLKAGDTESDLGGLPSVTTTATKDSPGGTYDIVIGMGTMHNGNYQFHFVNGKLTIFEYLINLSIIFRQ